MNLIKCIRIDLTNNISGSCVTQSIYVEASWGEVTDTLLNVGSGKSFCVVKDINFNRSILLTKALLDRSFVTIHNDEIAVGE